MEDENPKYFDRELKRMRLNEVLDSKKRNLDRFAIEQLLLDEQVKGYYQSAETLRQAYEATGYFNVDFQAEQEEVGEDDIHRIKAAKAKEKYQLIIATLETIKDNAEAMRIFRAKCVEEEWLIKAYFKLGKATIEQQRYLKTKIEKLLLQAEQEEAKQKLESVEFLLDMKNEFEAETGNGSYIPVQGILDRVASLLTTHGITYSRYGDGKKWTMCKLSKPLIDKYFDMNCSNRNGASVKLNRFKDELLNQH